MDIADEVKKLRTEMKMNRREFCEYFSIPYRTVVDWEAGKRTMPEYVLQLMKYKAHAEQKRIRAQNDAERRNSEMSVRDKEVLNMQLVLIPILAEAWNKSYSELSDLLKKYDVLSYIDVCYENYNSTGNQGIINDLREYIEMQGGKIA